MHSAVGSRNEICILRLQYIMTSKKKMRCHESISYKGRVAFCFPVFKGGKNWQSTTIVNYLPQKKVQELQSKVSEIYQPLCNHSSIWKHVSFFTGKTDVSSIMKINLIHHHIFPSNELQNKGHLETSLW